MAQPLSAAEQALHDAALEYHRAPTRGKIAVTPTKPLSNQRDLSLAYSPGVAYACLAIQEDPKLAAEFTSRANLVGVVTNGTAVLGLGDIGPAAALPVMEGKSALFKRFAGIDAWPLCLDTQDADAIVEIVRAISPGFAGINLEDISAPRCFEIEKRLREQGVLHVDYVSPAELATLYRNADVFVFPSIYEGFGFPVLEAMAHGAPVIAARSSSVPEIAGDAALYFPPNDAGALREALQRLLAGDLVHELDLRGGQVDVGGQQVHARDPAGHDHVLDPDPGLEEQVVDAQVHLVRVQTQTHRQRPLGVEVDEQHLAAVLRQRGTQVDRGRGLPDPTLLVAHRDDAGVAVRGERLGLGKVGHRAARGAERRLVVAEGKWLAHAGGISCEYVGAGRSRRHRRVDERWDLRGVGSAEAGADRNRVVHARASRVLVALRHRRLADTSVCRSNAATLCGASRAYNSGTRRGYVSS